MNNQQMNHEQQQAYYYQQQQQAYQHTAQSPPPLQHPTPTHPPAPILAQSPPPHYNQSAPQQHYAPYPPPPQQPPYGQPFSIPGLDMSGTAATQLGMQFGKSAFEAGQQYMQQNVGKYVPIGSVRSYWQVNNAYVVSKLMLLLFPYRNKSWTRVPQRSSETGQADGYKMPKEDVNAPDLYIPTMAFITYILLVGITKGTEEQFNPEILGLTASTGLGLLFFEVVLIKLACYLMSITNDVPMLDLAAYSGYIFVPMIAIMVVKMLDFTVVWWLYWAVYAYMSMSLGFFLLRSLRYTIFPDTTASSSTLAPTQRRRRVHFLFAVAALQWPLMYLMLT